ncbi:MAG TPA: S8 family serine peptidase [Thermoleophilaceae bacterium]
MAGVVVLFAACAPAAFADESAMPTTQARAYNAEWVPYLDPPEKPAAVCLVDSGVDITPDTPADSPNGPIVKRLSLDGGPGTAASATWEGGHGTRMAFVGAAPVNGWGAVGFWPGVRIVSIRAMPVGHSEFPFDYYSKAVDLCNKVAAAENVAAVNLSLGCDCQATATEQARLENQIVRAHSNDESVVAAAGNGGGVVGSPGNAAGVLAVAAGDRANTVCSFSNRGAGVDVVAPGCDVDLADPRSGQLWSGYQSGTSGASITASVVLALLRSYRPDLNWEGAEQIARSAAHSSAGPAVLDVEAIFRSAGLGQFVDAAKARVPSPLVMSSESVVAPSDGAAGAQIGGDDTRGVSIGSENSVRPLLAAPRVKALAKRRGRLTISVRNLPLGARLLVTLQARRSEFGYVTVRRARGAREISLRLPRRWRGGRLVLRYDRASPSRSTSLSVYRAVPR